MKSGIYLIKNTISGKEYIGSSQNLKRRKYKHWFHLKRNEHGNQHLQSAWNLYGGQAFHYMILEYCATEDLIGREDWWITNLDTMNPDKGYNLKNATQSEVSEETRAKLSAAGKVKVFSLEHRANISKANKGRVHSVEWKDKISAALKGRPKPEGFGAKVAAGLTGHEVLKETRERISIALKQNQR